jgi:hypothetical protein
LALGVAAAALAVVSTQAAAHPGKGKHTKRAKARAVSAVSSNDALEAQVHQLAGTVQSLQAELGRVRAAANHPAESAKVQELDQWMAASKAAGVEKKSKDNLVSVRGGWLGANNRRGGNNGSITNGAAVVPASGDILVGGAGGEGDSDAVYYGAAFDFNINNDLFGLMDNTSFQIEFGAEYAEFNHPTNSVLTGQQVTVNQLRVMASPKIKFMHDSKLRPWIIPVGLDINIISPPSGAVTVMNTGMNFGGGAEYEILKGIVLGGDVRYHYSMDDIDGVNTDGLSAGGSVGFKF